MLNEPPAESSVIPVMLEPLPNDAEALGEDYQRYLSYHLGRFQGSHDIYLYTALSYTLRDRMMPAWRKTWADYLQPGRRRAYYMSLEFLIGRSLGNNLLNLDLEDSVRKALYNYCADLEIIEATEPDAGLGNGGLGRLAACFMDSCATLKLPVVGYGIRYEYGMFRQVIENGYQNEAPDHWLRDGNPWEVERMEYVQRIQFGGRTEYVRDARGNMQVRWVDTTDVLAIPFDMPIVGYRNNTVNTLRLWKATATDEFNLAEFNAGDYTESVKEKNSAEHISMVLYPNDSSENGKELRLRQQYFLASASLKDAVRIWERDEHTDFRHFARDNVFQMNDTHPTIAVAELMRILMDDKGLGWEDAWDVTTRCMAYTNHTLLPEALERWPVHLFERLLPRLLDIIYEINARFLREVARRWPGDTERQQRMSIIEEGPVRQVRMAWLAIVGSFSVNGVAALHSELLIQGLFHDFYTLWPEKFNNKTNGVTPRRWLANCNPELATLISGQIGTDWVSRLEQLAQLRQLADDAAFRQQWRTVKRGNKERLAALVQEECGVTFDTAFLFDIQVKRIHEYKRQLLNLLHVIHLYIRVKQGRLDNWVDRCVLIGGKAAPGYRMAKDIIKLANALAEVINSDPEVSEHLHMVFLPNYRVSSMEVIAPAADLSEQISTAGKEASGTGNMKFMMNGALTIGTYDGANIEILEAVGEENFFLFGLHADDVQHMRDDYRPWAFVERDPDLGAVIRLLKSGHFNACEKGIFDNILNAMLSPHDPWMTLADFAAYVAAQEQVAAAWLDQERWTRMSILNTAASGFFSTDRTMQEYNRDIWKLTPGNGN
ncbi:MAG TPA: glycogen/starch/alpha-glucan phosphorylase [Thiolinea sp.]|nr:glycogen/starch/alpha-glucan phosphorylase [Thiolinea sp.]